MERKYLVSVPSWEIEDRHIVFNISTIPPIGETFDTKRRYREFERLNRKLDAKKLPRLNLPGKLLMHSDPAIENRRIKLEKALKNYVHINEMNPVLEEFLLPRDDVALHSSRRSSMQDSVMTVDESVITTRNDDSVMPLDEEEEPGFAETPQTGSEDESDAPSTEQSLTWALEMLAARSSYRAERRTNLRLARIYTLATIATLLGTMTARSHKWPLIGAAFGTAISAGFALLSAIWVKRSDDWRRRGFGLNESPLASTDGLDVRKLLGYLEERRREPRSTESSPKTLSNFTPGIEKKQLDTIVEEEPTSEDKRSPAEAVGVDSSKETVVVDETLMTKLDELHTMGSHYEIISMIKAYENFKHPSVAWRWARAVYYHTLFDTDSPAVAERLQEVLTNLHQSAALQRSALIHKWIAITHNALGDRRGAIKDKVEAGLAFELHTKTALEIDPQDPTLHYMHGRFCFDVAGLSWIERQGARAISGKEPPKATYQQALQHYLNALALKQSPAFYLEVGRCYQKLKKDSEALENFRKAASFEQPEGEPLSIEEESAREEAKNLVKTLSA